MATKIIINGVNGRMGKILKETALKDNQIQLVCGTDVPPDSIEKCANNCDVIIDFSNPSSTDALLIMAKKLNCGLLIATTGHNKSQLDAIYDAAKNIPIFMASNTSVGVWLLNKLGAFAATTLGDSCEIEIIEKHHNRKLDAPSGTALTLAKTINSVYKNQKNLKIGRTESCGKRNPNDLTIHSVRGGTIVGEHEVMFVLNDEVLSISHTAYSPQIFALGALKAAKFLHNKPVGLYSMDDMLS